MAVTLVESNNDKTRMMSELKKLVDRTSKDINYLNTYFNAILLPAFDNVKAEKESEFNRQLTDFALAVADMRSAVSDTDETLRDVESKIDLYN